MANKKAETIEKIKSRGYEVTSDDGIVFLDKYWIGDVLGDGRIEITYRDTLNRIKDQIKLRENAKEIGINVVEPNRMDIVKRLESKISILERVLGKI